MYVDDLDIPVGKISDPVRRIIDRAIDESRRRGGGELRVTLSTKLVASSRFTMPAARAIWWSTGPTSSSRCCKRHRACPCRSFGSTASIPRFVSKVNVRARPGTAPRTAEEAIRAPALSQAVRDQPEHAGAAGQAAAGLRTRPGDPAGAGGPLSSRARQVGDATRRAWCRQNGNRRRAGPSARIRS